MTNRLLFLVMIAGLVVAGWSFWQWYGGSAGAVQNKERAQAVSENWDSSQIDAGYTEAGTDVGRADSDGVEVRDARGEAENQNDENFSEEENGVHIEVEGKSAEKVEKIKGTEEAAAEDSTVSGKKTEQENGEVSYQPGDRFGELIIPKLGMVYEVYWGTDDDTLNKGVGYHDSKFTTPPDGMGHTVLSGHRDTVFSELGDLEEGDRLYTEVEGKVYEYQIRNIWITDAEDRTVIVEKDSPTLTLTTCYPFNFFGVAPDRYIIQAELTDVREG
ncbi:class D sortase [Evansella sp. LMS18]|uniref:class D sortase n=1 Tax=Evansella sp. LMS18 TaxID=2924033 RepID=UPI0020D0F4A6|nr:class D sortase [Evansella sp. LMS18]UTR11973.1 class D sortase [Evansella sp. LMS18]